jgi:hypothetical protein
METSTSARLSGDRLAIVLFCIASALAIVLYLVEKTPVVVSVCLC